MRDVETTKTTRQLKTKPKELQESVEKKLLGGKTKVHRRIRKEG